MARISQRLGPSVDYFFVQAGVQEPIPGLTITRFFDEGELLVLYACTVNNENVAETEFRLKPRVDGQSLAGDSFMGMAERVPQGEAVTISGSFIKSIAAGVHTIALFCQASNVPNARVLDLRTVLTVIQLPQWDQPTDVLEAP